MKLKTTITAIALCVFASQTHAWNPFASDKIDWKDKASIQAAFPDLKDATEDDQKLFVGTLMMIAAERSEAAKAKGLKGQDAVPAFIFSGEAQNFEILLEGVTKSEVEKRFKELKAGKDHASAKVAEPQPVPAVIKEPAMEGAAKLFYASLPAKQQQCITDKVEVKYLGQTGYNDSYMHLEFKNNTNVPSAWFSIEIVQKDAKYGNVLQKETESILLDNTIGTGETASGGWFGVIRDGRKVEVKVINMRDLEGKRLVDDNTNYLGSDFPEDISSVICK